MLASRLLVNVQHNPSVTKSSIPVRGTARRRLANRFLVCTMIPFDEAVLVTAASRWGTAGARSSVRAELAVQGRPLAGSRARCGTVSISARSLATRICRCPLLCIFPAASHASLPGPL